MTDQTALAPFTTMTLRVTRGRKTTERPIATVNEASAWWCQYRDSRNMGASAAPRVEIVAGGEVRAFVAYNGRVFPGTARDWKPGTAPVFDPYEAG